MFTVDGILSSKPLDKDKQSQEIMLRYQIKHLHWRFGKKCKIDEAHLQEYEEDRQGPNQKNCPDHRVKCLQVYKSQYSSLPSDIQLYICIKNSTSVLLNPVLWVCMFLGLPEPDPSLFCTDTDPDPDLDLNPSINTQKREEESWFLLFCDFFLTFYLWRLI
jgi:hypothetical protein